MEALAGFEGMISSLLSLLSLGLQGKLMLNKIL